MTKLTMKLSNMLDKLSCSPLQISSSTSDLYTLAVNISDLVFTALLAITPICHSPASTQIIQTALNITKKEQNIFLEWQRFDLNCTLSYFYESGGAIIPAQFDQDDRSKIASQVKQRLHSFWQEWKDIQLLLERMEEGQSIHSEIHEVYHTCMIIREKYYLFFCDLAQLYPEGRLRNALNNIINTIEPGNTQLGEVFLKLL
ncbi:MAG TPA: hypothetical protein GX404_04440 [Syntrophomonadaceae bacterium]|nr:hypothetical protein [Syntrophomonadaceae bacterium]